MPSNRNFNTLMENTYFSPYEEEYNRQILRIQDITSKSERITRLIMKQMATSQELQQKFAHLPTLSSSDTFTKRLIIAQCVLLCKRIKNLNSKIKKAIAI